MIGIFRADEHAERGHGFIELAIVIPVLLGIAIVGLDLARSLRVRQLATAFTREAASIAYRDCSAETDAERVESCLEKIRNLIVGRSDILGGTPQVILAIYDGQGGSIVRLGRVGDSVDESRSRVQHGDSEIDPDERIGKAILAHEVVVTAEIFAPFQPLLGGVLPLGGSSGGFSLGQAYEIYDATIM